MRKFVFSALMLLTTVVFAQYITPTTVIDGATGNIVYTDVNKPPAGADPFSWSGFTNTTSTGGGFSGGYQPAWNPNTGTFMFGYAQGHIAYSTPVNFALASAGTNIQVNGFKYSWEYINQDYSRGSLTGNINLTNKSGQVVENYNYNMPRTTAGWTLMSGIQNFNTQYAASTIDRLNVSFTGKDDRFWAGYYGPQIRAIDVSLLYSVTPPPIPTDFLRWVPLGNENDTFTLTTAGVVRYGANGTYVYQNFQPGTYSCSNSAWGVDPIGGVYKACSFGSNNVPTTPTPTPTLPKTTTTADTTYTTGVTLLDPTTTTTTTDPVATTSTTTTAATTTATVDTTTTPTTTSSPSTQQSVVTAVVSAPAPTTTTSSSTTTASSSTTSSSSQSSKEASGSGGSSSLALSIISKNSERDAAGAAVAQSAVAQATQAAAQAQQEAANVASSATANSLTVNAVSSGGQQSSGNGIRVNSSNSTNFSLQSGVSTIASVSGPATSANMIVQQQNNGTTGISIATGQQVTTVNTGTVQSTTSTATTFVLPLMQPQQVAMIAPVQTYTALEQQPNQTTLQNNTLTQTPETYSLMTPNMLTDKTNPLTDIVEGKQNIPQSNTAVTTGPVVNKNAQDSDVAGGVSINKMATAPAGYGDYLNFTMRDVAFYAPKEVYKNQRNVDNARALRTLTNDSKHKEMVEMQYAR